MIARRQNRQRSNRRAVSAGGLILRPPLGGFAESGLVLWLMAGMGYTTDDAAVASPSDLSTGSWTVTNLSNRTATTITDSTDGAPTTHAVQQAVPNLQTNHLARITVGIPSASGGGQFVAISTNGGATFVIVDAQAGTITFQSGTALNATYVGGVLNFDTIVTNTTFGIFTANTGTNISYTGASNRTATLGPNGLGAFFTVTQRNVSALADQSGRGNHASQVTGGQQPLLVSSGFGGAGTPYLALDGVDDSLSINDSADFFFGTGTWAVFAAVRRLSGAGAAFDCVIGQGSDTAGTGFRTFFDNTATPFKLVAYGNGPSAYGASTLTVAQGSDFALQWGYESAAGVVMYGKNGTRERNASANINVPDSANVIKIGVDNTGASPYFAEMRLAELLVYKRAAGVAFSDAESAAVLSYLQARHGI